MAGFSTPLAQDGALYRVNCGGEGYTDPEGNVWEADRNFFLGGVFASTNNISGTDKPMIYQTERWAETAYTFSVGDGTYEVALHFAELVFDAAGKRVFSVDINGSSVLENFDIVAEVGAFSALVKTFTVPAVNGQIKIGFRNSVDNAKISAIEILSAEAVGNRVARALPSLSEVSVKAMGSGSLSLKSASGKIFSATVRDVRGKAVAGLTGTAKGTISGLRPGLYMVEVTSGGRKAAYSIPVL